MLAVIDGDDDPKEPADDWRVCILSALHLARPEEVAAWLSSLANACVRNLANAS